MFVIGLLIGLFVGATIGAFAVAFLFAGKNSDNTNINKNKE
jgi:gas vesicle protein